MTPICLASAAISIGPEEILLSWLAAQSHGDGSAILEYLGCHRAGNPKAS
jgi:hypothetical protein